MFPPSQSFYYSLRSVRARLVQILVSRGSTKPGTRSLRVGSVNTRKISAWSSAHLYPKEAEDGTIEMVWDMTIDRMPGQADEYHMLPLYGGVTCQLVFFADKKQGS